MSLFSSFLHFITLVKAATDAIEGLLLGILLRNSLVFLARPFFLLLIFL